MLVEHPALVGYTPRRCGGDVPARSRCAGRHPGRLLAGDGPPRAHRILRRRDRVHPALRPRDAAFQPPHWTEALLLPLTETPVTGKILAAINARLTRSGTDAGAALEGGEEPGRTPRSTSRNAGAPSIAQHRDGWVRKPTIFPGWEFFAPIAPAAAHAKPHAARSPRPRHAHLPRRACDGEEPGRALVEQGRGSATSAPALAHSSAPKTSTISRGSSTTACAASPAAISTNSVRLMFSTQTASNLSEWTSAAPTQRFPRQQPRAYRSHPRAHPARGARADRRAEPGRSGTPRRPVAGVPGPLPPRLAYASSGSITVYSESSYLTGDLRTPVIVRTAIANGVQVLDLRDADGRAAARQIVLFGANALIDDADVQARPVTRSKSKTSAFVSDFRDLAVGDYGRPTSSTASRNTAGCVSSRSPASRRWS